MNSSVFMNYKSKFTNISHEQEGNARNRYISSVYFHTIFLYTISRKRKYEIKRQTEDDYEDEDLGEYLSDIFSSNYGRVSLELWHERPHASLRLTRWLKVLRFPHTPHQRCYIIRRVEISRARPYSRHFAAHARRN